MIASMLLLAACTSGDAPVEDLPETPEPQPVVLNVPDESGKRVKPDPLPVPNFKMPKTERRTLSNGLEVVVATNNEVPLWSMQLLFNVGGFADPEGKEGLAAVTMDMLNEGAGGLSAEQIDSAATTLGSSVGSSANFDGATVAASGIKRNLEPTLDLWAKVLLQPEFPEDDWEIVRKRRLAAVVAGREDPSNIARTAFRKIMYGAAYRGRPATEDSYKALTTEDMKGWYGKHIGPSNAIILVGGSLTADEIVPLLEARLASWKPADIASPKPVAEPTQPDKQVMYFIDKPGAAQSMVRMGSVVGARGDEDYFDFAMGNLVLGGAFTARLNMNLREDKGYTYGARCGTMDDLYGPGLWYCAASVQTAVTGPSLAEFKSEVEGVLGDRPVTAEELAYFQSYEINGYPGNYETVGALIGEQASIWRYGLPADWPERFIPGVQGVTLDSANGALKKRVSMDHVFWLVVGDREVVYADVEKFGLPIIELDRDGNILEG